MSFAEKTSMLDWMSRLYLPPVIIRPGTYRKKSNTLSAFVQGGFFLTGPPDFQYHNEKTCSANEELFYIENFVKN